ncbi:hypothetical protein, partial [Vibrio parahaemolyticus]|uniref:hypothetical protein n=1 Tax=Vibrio parahaemolyticus TaxID=670 RepID=UPI003F665FD5
LRLTLLAPDIVEAILDGKQGPEVTLARVLGPFPVEWANQQGQFEQIAHFRSVFGLVQDAESAIGATTASATT